MLCECAGAVYSSGVGDSRLYNIIILYQCYQCYHATLTTHTPSQQCPGTFHTDVWKEFWGWSSFASLYLPGYGACCTPIMLHTAL
eukprot:COSAG01_NODE_3214_length_6407_cov_5.475428_11_plen_85_part_00